MEQHVTASGATPPPIKEIYWVDSPSPYCLRNKSTDLTPRWVARAAVQGVREDRAWCPGLSDALLTLRAGASDCALAPHLYLLYRPLLRLVVVRSTLPASRFAVPYGECMAGIDFRLPWGEDYCS